MEFKLIDHNIQETHSLASVSFLNTPQRPPRSLLYYILYHQGFALSNSTIDRHHLWSVHKSRTRAVTIFESHFARQI